MDLYSTSFTVPRHAGSVIFAHDGGPALNGTSQVNYNRAGSQSEAQGRQSVAEPSTSGRLGSMRSRFPPSVKAFMPSAFGGKRTSERIIEAVGPGAEKSDAEGDTDGEDAMSSAHKMAASNIRSSLAVGSHIDGTALGKNRDSRSTIGTRSSLDFSSAASLSESTAASTAGGVPHAKPISYSDPASATHSASHSLSVSGLNQSQSAADLTEAIQRLSVDVMANHQCLVTFTPVLSDETSASATISQAFPRQGGFPPYPGSDQLPFPSSTGANGQGYPYQQYQPQPLGTDSLGFPSMGGSSTSLPGLLLNSQHRATPDIKKKVPQYNFHLSGGYQQVMSARGAILRDHPFQTRVSIKVPRADILEASSGSPPNSDVIKYDVKRRLDDIALATKANITITGTDTRGTDLGYGLETERLVELVISGPFESMEQAKVRILVLFDELSGLHSESCEIDYKLHNIIGGRKRCVIQTIQEETATNIYLPTPFSGVLGNGRNANNQARQNAIYITGEFFGVQRARDMLFQVSLHKSKCIISRDAAILPRKLDWMLCERLEELRSIMLDNGTFINLPVLGSQASLISVFGDNRVNIERTIRSIMQLACQFYVASLWLLPMSFDVFMSSANLNPSQMTPILKHISNMSGAEVVFKSNCFEIHGLESEVRNAVSLILELDVVQNFNFEVKFQIELANEHREFISGKKNGKINKVMKQCGVRIKFETFNDYNFLIDISGNNRDGAMQGLGLLQEELPAEMSFHVPEAYHKRIIGVGGKNIQRIMKKYGVYVKFSNAEEFAALGGYLDNEDNVIARTPAKNAINLENLKQSVMELVNPKDKDYVTETVSISRRYHRTLLGEKAIFIHDIESKTNSIVRFPPKETASDLVVIFGPESQIHIASQMLLDHVPFEAEFRTPSSPELAQVVATQDFVAMAERVKRDLNIVIVPVIRHRQLTEAVFKLRLNRSNSDFLPTAKDALEDFLISRNINVYASPDRARSDSFASAFPHFANKLLSQAAAAESNESFHSSEQARFNERRLRAAASTPDIKALFDSPASYNVGHNYTTATNSPLITSTLYPSPYGGDGRGFGSDVWGAPRNLPASSSINATPSIAPPVSSVGIQFPQHNPRLSDDLNLLHRNTETLGVDERMRALRKPRSFAHRAQSLDIGALAAQQAAQGAVGAPSAAAAAVAAAAYSPARTPGAIQAPPYSNVGSAGHHHVPASSISRLAPGAQVPNPSTMDEVSRVLAQLAFDRA
ncbi:hypothetical protein IE53DRAFT_188135 [Violaceomyces palustris]|uniref:Uncharacterized protein n=1 Tax=Violaceomyces palustris TaxID=1673888 RepID=A0ACD0NS52_9BASI|nr:hypothetical protein IE53DRAFT_188135 [Violaceomyces palustris]